MNEVVQPSSGTLPVLPVLAGQDRFGEGHGLGISAIAFKVIPPEGNGVLILENTFHARGGHLAR